MTAQRPFIRRSAAVVGTLLAGAFVLLCATRSSANELPNPLVPTTVEVPSSLRKTPFDQDRVLMVPPGFKISVLARIPAARFIMPLSTGEIFVAQPAAGSILLLRSQTTAVNLALLLDSVGILNQKIKVDQRCQIKVEKFGFRLRLERRKAVQNLGAGPLSARFKRVRRTQIDLPLICAVIHYSMPYDRDPRVLTGKYP